MGAVEVEQSHRGRSVRTRWRGPGRRWGSPRGGGRPGGGRRRVRRPPRRGSGASPAAPAGHIDCARPAPPFAGRRCRARAGSTTGGRARGACRVASATAVARPPESARVRSRTTRSRISARRASAASRWRRSATLAGLSVVASRPPGRSSTSRSTERPARSEPAIDEALVEGDRRDDDEPLEPDAAGDGLDRIEAARRDRARPRSSPAPGPPRRAGAARVVRPLEPSPRIATLADCGRPPGPRIASSAAKPGVDDAVVVEVAGFGPWRFSLVRCDRRLGCQGQCPHDPRSCGTPSSPEARDSGVHISTSGRHRTSRLEHPF